MAQCDNCMANKVCDHNRFGFENCGNYIPTADVAPRAEVEKLQEVNADLNESLRLAAEANKDLQAEIRGYSIAKEYDAEHFMADIKKLEAENNTLIKSRDKLLQCYAREIFEKIYDDCFDQFGYINYEALAELKKKYTEDDLNSTGRAERSEHE